MLFSEAIIDKTFPTSDHDTRSSIPTIFASIPDLNELINLGSLLYLYILAMNPDLYHRILYYCDGATILNALCVSTVYHNVTAAEIVRSYARKAVRIQQTIERL